MKVFFVFLFLLHVATITGQPKLDYGTMQADSNFNCADDVEKFYFGVDNICNSKNELEIRLRIFSFPGGPSELIDLYYSNGKWCAEKFKSTRQGGNVTIKEHSAYNIPADDQPIFNIQFNGLFERLRQNNIFLLPNQGLLNYQKTIHDGVGFSLTFKAGNSYRRYHFDNPYQYQNNYPDIKEFRNYTNICNALINLFK